MNADRKRNFIILLILASAYNSIYSLTSMKSLYYTLMQSGLGLSHFRLGQLYSIQGIFSMFSYLCGAFFLNRFARWKLIAGSSLIVGIFTIWLTFLPPYPIILSIFGFIGFLVGATFYPAHLEVLHQLGNLHDQGKIFGLFFVLNNVFGILFASLGFSISSLPLTDDQKVRGLLFLFAGLNIAAALFSLIYLRRLPPDTQKRSPVSMQVIRQLVRNKNLWLVILVVMTNYTVYGTLNYALPYLKSAFSLPSGISNALTIVRFYLIGILAAPVAGRITDHIHSASRLLKSTFALYCATIFLLLVFAGRSAVGAIACVLALCLFANMGKSMALVTIDEARISPSLYSVAISFIAFCAYSPDAFYYSFSGWVLDAAPTHGYRVIFLIAGGISLLGMIASHLLCRNRRQF
jgi:MFS family permease